MVTVFDVIKNPNLAHLNPMLFPRVLEDKGSKLHIRTKLIVPKVITGKGLRADERGTMQPYTTEERGFVSLWMVFDWNNDIVWQSLEDGECDVSKMDTIAYLRLAYPGLNDYSIEYVMDLSTSIDQYLRSMETYQIKDSDAETNANRVDKEVQSSLVGYDELLDSPSGNKIPMKIRKTLIRENLVGGVRFDRKDGVTERKILSENDVVLSEPILRYNGTEFRTGILSRVTLY